MSYKVTRLPKDPGPAAWNAILPPIPASSPLQSEINSDWLVIGAGFAGLAAARRLSQLHPGERITQLEASRVAEGPAGRNSGFMIDLPHDLSSHDYGGSLEHDERDVRLNRAGIDYALAARQEFGMCDEALSASGKVNAALTSRGCAHNDAYAKHLDALGEPYEWLDATAMREMTGCECYLSGLFSPGTAMIQPALFIRGMAAGVTDQGVKLYEQSPVIELQRKGAVWIARTPSGKVTAPNVILTVNGHAESFGLFPRRLMHIFTYASMSRAMTQAEIATLGGHRKWALTPADPLGTTVRRVSGYGGDRIIIRNRATFDPSMEVTEARIKRMSRQHENTFATRFPMLDKLTMEYSWGGRLCLSRNGAAAFGQVESGLFSACCQNGLGTAKGMVSGMLAADLASGKPSLLLADMQSISQPARLPPAPLLWLGANALLRWGEFRAGQEL